MATATDDSRSMQQLKEVPRGGQMPQAGDPAHFATSWHADRFSRQARAAVAAMFGWVVVLLMVATFEFSPSPGHQLAGVMLWLTALGILGTWLAPRFMSMRGGTTTLRLATRRAGEARRKVRQLVVQGRGPSQAQRGAADLALLVRGWIGVLAVLSAMYLAPARWSFVAGAIAVVVLVTLWAYARSHGGQRVSASRRRGGRPGETRSTRRAS